MEEQKKKAIFNIAVSKSIGNSEQMQVSMAAYEGETKEEIASRVNFAFDIFGERIRFNNEKLMQMQKEYEEELKKTPLKEVK